MKQPVDSYATTGCFWFYCEEWDIDLCLVSSRNDDLYLTGRGRRPNVWRRQTCIVRNANVVDMTHFNKSNSRIETDDRWSPLQSNNDVRRWPTLWEGRLIPYRWKMNNVFVGEDIILPRSYRSQMHLRPQSTQQKRLFFLCFCNKSFVFDKKMRFFRQSAKNHWK